MLRKERRLLSFTDFDYLISTLNPHVNRNMTNRVTSWIVLIYMGLDYEMPWTLVDVDM